MNAPKELTTTIKEILFQKTAKEMLRKVVTGTVHYANTLEDCIMKSGLNKKESGLNKPEVTI